MKTDFLSFEVKRIRGELALTQAELGERLGVTSVTVARWENGDRGCSKEMLEKIRRLRSKISIGDVLPDDLANLSPSDAVRVFQHLFFAKCDQASIPAAKRHVSLKDDTADGGVDAWIDSGVAKSLSEPLFRGNTYFQIKSGSSFKPWQASHTRKELFGSRKACETSLGEAVLKCLRENGRYCLVSFGQSLTKPQRDTAIGNFRSHFSDCGFPEAQIEVLDQGNLIDLLRSYPSLCLSIRGNRGGRYRFFDEWSLDPELRRPFVLSDAQQRLIETIRGDLCGTKFRHIRICGEPGLGKTRVVLEALGADDLRPFVIYFESPELLQGSDLFNAILRRDDGRYSLLVVDDCSPDQCRSIWRQVLPHSDRIRLVTIDHDPEQISDAQMRSIACPELEPKVIEAILEEYGIGEFDSARWVAMCDGSPRMAHLIGENHRNSSGDALAALSTTDCWRRIISACARDSSEADVVFRVLRYLSLFEKFGFEKPVQSEADHIFDWLNGSNPDILRSRFDSIVENLRKKRILQGTHTLFIVPRALQVYLWTQFWEHDAIHFNLTAFFSALPASLVHWFTANFKFAHRSSRARNAIAELLSDRGGIRVADLLQSEAGCKFIAELTEADPESTVKSLTRTLGTWPPEQVLAFTDGRQHIVWALQKAAVWPATFDAAARLLARLATGENSTYGNNSTEVFNDLFSLAYGVGSATEVPPRDRWHLLEAMLESTSQDVRALAIQACDSALATYHSGRMIGPEHQGLRPTANLWLPKTGRELFEAYRHAWRLLTKQLAAASDGERGQVVEVLIRRSAELLSHIPDLATEIGETILSLIDDEGADLRALVKNLQWLKRHGKKLSVKSRRCTRAIERKISGTTFKSKFRRAILLADHFEDFDENGDRTGLHEKKIEAIASDCINRLGSFGTLLPELVCQQGHYLAVFGTYLGRMDISSSVLGAIATARKEAGHRGNEILLGSYLRGMSSRGDEKREDVILSFLTEANGFEITASLSSQSGFTSSIVQKLLDAVDRGGGSLAVILHSINYSCGFKDIPEGTIRQLLERATTECDRDAIVTALQVAEHYFDECRPSADIPHEVIRSLLTRAVSVYGARDQDLDWIMQRWVRRLIPLDSPAAVELLRTFLLKCEDWKFELHFTHSMTNGLLTDIVTAQPREAWSVVSRFFDDVRSRVAWNILHWVAPLGEARELISVFPESAVLEWASENAADRAPFLAKMLPKQVARQGRGKLTRECLLRFGHSVDFRRALLSRFHSGGWCGSASQHYGDLRDVARGWLADETAQVVREWLEWHIDALTQDIDRERIREEREF